MIDETVTQKSLFIHCNIFSGVVEAYENLSAFNTDELLMIARELVLLTSKRIIEEGREKEILLDINKYFCPFLKKEELK